MTTTTRDFAAEYIAARKDSRAENATIDQRMTAQTDSAKIARAARRAGVKLDEIGLDEQARRELHPVAPARPQIIGYTATGLPIYG